MPIIPSEPFAFPANPFDLSGSAVEYPGSGEWFVLHTKSRAEKTLARWLLSASLKFFLPLYKKQTPHAGGRVQTSYTPLFSGYLFMWGDGDARYHALASNQVAKCLPVHDQDSLEADLASVYQLMTVGLPLAPAQQIPPGSPVEVIEGPFAGLTGRLISAGAKSRLFVEVRMINQGVSVELDARAVRPLTENGQAERARIALLRI